MDVDRLTRWQEERQNTRPLEPLRAELLADLMRKTPEARPPAEVLVDLRKTVGDATDLLRALTFTYLVASAYIAVAVGSVGDRELLVGTTIQLPALRAGSSGRRNTCLRRP